MNQDTVMEAADRMERKADRKIKEAVRIAQTKDGKERAERRRTTITVLETGGKRRTVRKTKTICDKMLTAKQLPKHLKVAIDSFAALVADGLGAATGDFDESTNRMTACYDGMSGGSFGSRTPSDRQLDGMTAYRTMTARIPEEMIPLYRLILAEEIGTAEIKRSMISIGEEFGFTHKQATAAAAMQVVCIAAMVAHFLKDQAKTATKRRAA